MRAFVTTHSGGFPEALLANLLNLEIFVVASVDTVFVNACAKRNVSVTNTPNILTNDVVDMTMLLILETIRLLLPGFNWIQSGRWQRDGMMSWNTSLMEKKFGVVGLAQIAQAVASRYEVFGMGPSYYRRRMCIILGSRI